MTMINNQGKRFYEPSGMTLATNGMPSNVHIRPCPFCGSVNKRVDLFLDVRDFGMKKDPDVKIPRSVAGAIVCGCGCVGTVLEFPKDMDGNYDINRYSEDAFRRLVVQAWNSRAAV